MSMAVRAKLKREHDIPDPQVKGDAVLMGETHLHILEYPDLTPHCNTLESWLGR